jgi:hypothetical protein
MFKSPKFIALLLISTLLTGCASYLPVTSRVSVFQQFPPEAKDGNFSVVPWRSEMAGGLEFASYADQVSATLTSNGFNVSPASSETEYLVIVDYGIDEGQLVSRSYSIPQFGVTGSSGSNSTATINRFGNTATAQISTTNTPTYGITGYNQVNQIGREYVRYFSVDVVRVNSDGTIGNKIYEGRLKSEGSCGNLQALMPIFVSALLADFPSQGGTRTVSAPLVADC